ncbi:hypothetical protein EIP86_009550 [Pleurotus ostreatoroseus]|nr:hypothetical protein EIP86_009550 [Pleurotus ostreatoroseus]
MRAYATVLAFAASALAYQVTAPTNATGFSTDGSNTVSWDRVSTDPQNFTIVLVNNNVFPNYEQVLDALVDGTQSTIQVNPPSTGWPSVGTGYQINFVQDSQHLTTILAQSNDFSFHAPTSSSGSSSASGSSTGSLSGSSASAATGLTVSQTSPSSAGATNSAGSSSNSAAGSNSAGASGSGSDLNPSSSDTATTASQTNGAASTGAHAALFGAVALVGALLA